MSTLPSDKRIFTLEYSADGSPWCRTTAKSSIVVDTLEYSLDGSPWWGQNGQEWVGTCIKSIVQCTFSNMKKVIGVSKRAINTVIELACATTTTTTVEITTTTTTSS